MAQLEEACTELRMGRPVVVVVDNEPPIMVAGGETLSPETVNFACRYGSGITYALMGAKWAEHLNIPAMEENFLVSVDAREGVSTGISAFDRARTLNLLASEEATFHDFTAPGHVFPVVTTPGGVLKKNAGFEAGVDLVRLAGLNPVAMATELWNEAGEVPSKEEVERFVKEHGLVMVSVEDVIRYRLERELIVQLVGSETLDSPYGTFRVMVYQDIVTGGAHLVLVKGEIRPDRPVLVRVHSECLTGDVFHSYRCDCGPQLFEAIERIGKEGGVLVSLRQEGRGIGLLNKVMAYSLQDRGLDTVEANEALGFKSDMREYGIASQILYHIGVRKVRLLTNNPTKIQAIKGFGIDVVAREAIEVPPRPENIHYLRTKKTKMGHLLEKV